MGQLVLLRAEVAQSRGQPVSIVGHLDVFKYLRLGLLARGKAFACYRRTPSFTARNRACWLSSVLSCLRTCFVSAFFPVICLTSNCDVESLIQVYVK